MSEADANKDAMSLFEEDQLRAPGAFELRYSDQVSGGQLQRAMTAMSMICKPDLIIFDGPTTALDVRTQIEVLAAIKKIVGDHNTAVIYITHDLAVVAQVADRIKILRYGEEAQTAEMLENPREDYAKSLWAVRQFCKEAQRTEGAKPLVKMSNVSAHYGDLKVLDDISVDLYRGRRWRLLAKVGRARLHLPARCVTVALQRRGVSA